jgi:5-methylcytosine-specific restriction endonuclease McrA
MARRNFSAATKAKARERSAGKCELHLIPRCLYRALPEKCSRPAWEVDHITPDSAEGSNTLKNAAVLCDTCHAIKTVVDNKLAKKAARLRGETGQNARRIRAKAKGRYKPIAGRGFDKGWTKRMDGTTIKRETKP